MEAIYMHDWSGVEDMRSNFEISSSELDGIEVLLAYYAYRYYSGEAFVLFKKDGKLFEVNGSHCSCYGLEGQWSPEETTIEALEHRLNNGRLGQGWVDDENRYATELREVLKGLRG